MRKIPVLILALAIFFGIGGVNVTAEESSEGLYKYVKFADGTYGYDTSVPVNYYQGSQEQVMIPKTYTQDKEQFKSAWIATIFNLHFPQISDEAAVMAEYAKKLDTYEEWNMNAVIFQVRPVLDAAYYTSEINPQSAHFTGTQGVDAGFDPMPQMIEETHKRGMEFHAWFNPYRVTNTAYYTQMGITEVEADLLTPAEKITALNEAGLLADSNFAVLHPEYVLEFKGKLFINPGEPEVIQHVADTIKEFITKYDTDAIHFDDYFYPYKVNDDMFGSNGEDQATFEKYGEGYTDIEAWRRDNVTALIDAVRSVIDEHNAAEKTAVQFGISPFGIWEHKVNDDRGSNTPVGSSQSYSRSIFADTYQWVKDEKLDYIAPQIYWSFGAAAAPYGEIARWWNDVAEGTNVDVYVGHANYKHESNGGWDAEWMNPEEVNNQLKFNQLYPNITGSAIYSFNELLKTEGSDVAKTLVKNESIDILIADTFSTKSLTPSRAYLSHNDTVAVDSVKVIDNQLVWNDTQNDNARFYVIYASDSDQSGTIINAAENILDKVMFDGSSTYTYDIPEGYENMTFAVTVLDRAFVETEAVLNEIETPLDFSVKFTELTLNFQETLTDSEFIKRLGIESDIELSVTTNFNDVVKPSIAGTYTVDVVVTKKDTQDVVRLSTTQSKQFQVSVTVKEKTVTEDPKETVDPKEETPKDNGSNTENGKENLPQTGMSNTMILTGVIVLSVGALFVLTNRVLKREN